MKGLTKRQSDIITFIQDFIDANRYSPSFREIKNHFGFASVSAVFKHVGALKRKGIILSEPNRRRSLYLAETPVLKEVRPEIELPLIGIVSAGFPIETFSHTQSIAIPEFMVHVPEKTYVLRARGDNLQEEMISDGDLLIVEARENAQPGETVLALINHHDTIIKKYFPEGQYVRLAGHNPHHQPIILRQEDVVIQGVLVGMIRLF